MELKMKHIIQGGPLKNYSEVSVEDLKEYRQYLLWMEKKFIAMLLVIALGITPAITNPVPVNAETNVTSDLSDKDVNSLITLCQNDLFSVAFWEYIYNNMLPNGKAIFDFSKESKRRYVLKHINVCTYFSESNYKTLGGGSANTISKRIFGKSTSNIRTLEGDVGDIVPQIGYGERLFLWKHNSGKLTVDFTIYMVDGIYGTETEPIGFVTYTVKRKPGSKFGWIIKSAKLERY